MSYVLFINYGQKVVANRMHGFLRMRIAQFLSTCAALRAPCPAHGMEGVSRGNCALPCPLPPAHPFPSCAHRHPAPSRPHPRTQQFHTCLLYTSPSPRD